ncbi:glycoside hydrolase family 16 protein [Rhodoferax lacus]|nr:glycoside hydrolase family 16 protein [Rhodoferax lacus]
MTSIIAIYCIASLLGCGGGGGGGASFAASPASVASSTGVFLDSTVQGLRYDTATQHGETDANGQFKYLAGESVTFSVGNLVLASTPGKSLITPLDIAGTTNVADQRVTNMLVLLQSLDADGNTSNGIAIPAAASAAAPTGIDFDVSPTAFRSMAAITTFLANAVGASRQIVSAADADLHFQNSLNTGLGGTKINIAPFAIAGTTQSVAQGSAAQLDGRASGDANGDTLSYQWSVVSRPAGSVAVLTGATTATPSLVADAPGDYLLGLMVSDGVLSSPISVVKVSATAPNSVPSGYALVWSDEFNTSGIQLPDPSKWSYDIAQNKVGWFNGELQYYANGRLQNSAVQNGSLTITARRESLAASVSDWGGQNYTSARLFTKGKSSWTYGFFEIRAKLPCGAGTWPAIWTLGSTVDVWPDQGEIDIMEQTGWDKGTVLGTIHTLAGSGGNGSTGSTALATACNAFHNFQIKWTPTAIDFYVDGVSYRPTYNKPVNASGWPFDKPQYLLLNVAVGGVLGGTVNDATLSNTGLEVDYVRVYQIR